MDTILAPAVDGTYQTVFGREERGLFRQRLEERRYLFRHAASGLSLFHFVGEPNQAEKILRELSEAYDFHRDSTWVLKGQAEIHRLLAHLGLGREWLHRAWHYSYRARR